MNKKEKSAYNVFSNNINSLCSRHGEKKKFAEQVGVTYETLRQWCSGENLPNGVQLLKIAEVAGVSLDWLLTGKDPGEAFMADWPEEVKMACRQMRAFHDARHPLGVSSWNLVEQMIKSLTIAFESVRKLEKQKPAQGDDVSVSPPPPSKQTAAAASAFQSCMRSIPVIT